jgi:hypothetical protein
VLIWNSVPTWSKLKLLYSSFYAKAVSVTYTMLPLLIAAKLGIDITHYKFVVFGFVCFWIAIFIYYVSVPKIILSSADDQKYAMNNVILHEKGLFDIGLELDVCKKEPCKNLAKKIQFPEMFSRYSEEDDLNEFDRDTMVYYLSQLKYHFYDYEKFSLRVLISGLLLVSAIAMTWPLLNLIWEVLTV